MFGTLIQSGLLLSTAALSFYIDSLLDNLDIDIDFFNLALHICNDANSNDENIQDHNLEIYWGLFEHNHDNVIWSIIDNDAVKDVFMHCFDCFLETMDYSDLIEYCINTSIDYGFDSDLIGEC